jgi:hypothetical protein
VTVELGTNSVLGVDPDKIRTIPRLLEAERRTREIPLWDGKSGERAAKVIAEFLGRSSCN